VLALYAAGLVVLTFYRWLRIHPRSPDLDNGLRVLVSGRADSRNWCRAHLLPLAQAPCVRELITVMDGPTICHPSVRSNPQSAVLSRLPTRSIARSLRVFRLSAREKPDVIVGYSFFPAAFFGLLVAKAVGARAVYQMTSGPVDISNGGMPIGRLHFSMPRMLTRALRPMTRRICGHFDGVVVRGQRARRFVEEQCRPGHTAVIPGSIDLERFQAATQPRCYDVTFLGRIVPVKQPRHLLEVLARVHERLPDVRAVIAGTGPLLESMRADAQALNLERNTEFMGHVENVEDLLAKSKVFILTSASEGLSIALAEAMAAGAVPVVGDVGDLGELVRNAESGWLVRVGDFDAYADKIMELLQDDSLWQRFSANARAMARENNSLANVTSRWEQCLRALALQHGK